jgi:hypothetical protein
MGESVDVMGADPRSRGLTLDEYEFLDESDYTTAIEAAACCENVEIPSRQHARHDSTPESALIQACRRYLYPEFLRNISPARGDKHVFDNICS